MSFLITTDNDTSLYRARSGVEAPPLDVDVGRIGVSLNDTPDLPAMVSNTAEFQNRYKRAEQYPRGWQKVPGPPPDAHGLHQYRKTDPGQHLRRSTIDNYSRYPLELHKAGGFDPYLPRSVIGTRIGFRDTYDQRGGFPQGNIPDLTSRLLKTEGAGVYGPGRPALNPRYHEDWQYEEQNLQLWRQGLPE